MRTPFLLLLLPSGLFAQADHSIPLTTGFKVGAPLTREGSWGTFAASSDSRWTGGPTVEWKLPYGLAVEFDALYRNQRRTFTYPLTLGGDVNAYLMSSYAKTDIWDLPLLMKYRFRVGGLRPFVSAGYQWSRRSGTHTSLAQCLGPQGSCLPAGYTGLEPRSSVVDYTSVKRQAAGGAGLEFKKGWVTIAPEVRVHDGVTALVGFTFGK